MLAAQVVMYFIILTSAATLGAQGKTDVNSAADAASGLQAAPRPRRRDPLRDRHHRRGAAGRAGADRVDGLRRRGDVRLAAGAGREGDAGEGFYGVIVASTLVGMVVNYLGLSPIRALV